MSLGQKIKEARKRKGITLEELGDHVGLVKSSLSGYENDTLKNGPDPAMLVKLAEFLGDESILTTYLEQNPVYMAMIPKVFPDLNNIRTEPSTIFIRLEEEAREAADSASALAKIFSNMDYHRTPNFEELFKQHMEQILDFKRGAEIAEFKLVALDVMTRECHKEIYERQQMKCEDKGHHIPEEKRNGTEG